ncbi:MAG: four helix bundle protein [Chitinophagaceae bacterium]
MATIHRFEDLEIWQMAFAIYKKNSTLAQKIRAAHEFRFADQMKTAAGSVMDNIAEGFERRRSLEFINSLSIAKGECGELQSQLYRCLHDKYIDEI